MIWSNLGTKMDLTCQASSSCDSSSLRWMASNNWLFRHIMSFLLFSNSASIRFFLERNDKTFSHITVIYEKCNLLGCKSKTHLTVIHEWMNIQPTMAVPAIRVKATEELTWLWLRLGLWWPVGRLPPAPVYSAACASVQRFPVPAARSGGGRNEMTKDIVALKRSLPFKDEHKCSLWKL